MGRLGKGGRDWWDGSAALPTLVPLRGTFWHLDGPSEILAFVIPALWPRFLGEAELGVALWGLSHREGKLGQSA